jgi:purine-binding chemotaxis protein CheW
MQARARMLAEAPQSEQSQPASGHDYLAVQIGRERFALPTAAVQGVMALRQCVSLPGTPDHLRGLINVRSRIVPVVDLAVLWRLGPAPEASNHVVLLEVDRIELGVLVQTLLEVCVIAEADFRPLGQTGGINARHLRGLAGDYTVIDLPALLPDLIVDHSRSVSPSPSRP